LDPKTRRLIKLALAIGGSMEGAVHSHVRRAVAEGIAREELHHVMLLAIPTLGFPAAVKAMTWIDDILSDR
jgi:alkylhydroperoxidase/carboxymuconolactone decarboxylase family protein YurZ